MTFVLLFALLQLPVEITLDADGTFRVAGWTGSPEAFSVRVDEEDVPPMMGTLRADQTGLVFTPRYPLQPGLRYRATLNFPDRSPLVKVFDITKPYVEPTTFIEDVFPSGNVIPENLLKIYIHFSAPMSRGEVYQRTHLLDENGNRIDLPFLELPEELWDQDYRRLTILFDPGRIKRGLVPNEEVGSPLMAGKKYTLVIDREWIDAEGNPLKAGLRKQYTVTEPDRKVIELGTWQLRTPRAGTRDSFFVQFPEPLDRALVQRHLDVIDSSGNVLRGSIEVEGAETRWIFTPQTPWEAGDYSLRIGTVLADLAGNMIDRPFDVDIFEKVDERIVRETKLVRFNVN